MGDEKKRYLFFKLKIEKLEGLNQVKKEFSIRFVLKGKYLKSVATKTVQIEKNIEIIKIDKTFKGILFQ
jgi:hypothetical protein